MKRKGYLSWEEYFIQLALLTAKRSKDPSTQVGACIVDPESKKILSLGYNGMPRGCEDDDFPWDKNNKDYEDNKYPYVVHAELNAILNATCSLKGSVLYVTHEPCEECLKAIIQAGIKEVNYIYPYKNNPVVRKRILGATHLKMNQINIDLTDLPEENYMKTYLHIGEHRILLDKTSDVLCIVDTDVKEIVNIVMDLVIESPIKNLDISRKDYSNYGIFILFNGLTILICSNITTYYRGRTFYGIYNSIKHVSREGLEDFIMDFISQKIKEKGIEYYE